MPTHIRLREPSNLKDAADAFFEIYDAEGIYFSIKRPLREKKERICRFCGKKCGEGNTKFNADAHLISHLLGNHELLSDFECDKCNSIFAKYESELAICFSPYLSFYGVKGKRGVPTFTSNGGKVRIERIEFKGKPLIVIRRSDPDDDSFTIERENGQNSIDMIKGSYIPLSVYKAFVKMGISCLQSEDAPMYSNTLRFLTTDKLDHIVKGVANIHLTLIPSSIHNSPPVAFLYKKKSKSELYPTHIFAIQFANCYVQLVLPFNINDIKNATARPNEVVRDIPLCPPVFLDPPEHLDLVTSTSELHSVERKRLENQSFYFGTDPENLKEAVSYNAETGVYGSIDTIGATKTIIIGEQGMVFSKEEISELLEILKRKEIESQSKNK